jgi:hypothetical protein
MPGYKFTRESGGLALRAVILPPPLIRGLLHLPKREKETLYLTNNEIPVKSTEMTAPRLVLGVARDFQLSNKNQPPGRSQS